MAQKTEFVTPVGRMVAGDLYEPNTTDGEGKPLLIKNGPNAGKPRVEYYLALAIPKQGEQHWASTEWGAKIWAAGHAAFPQVAASPAFAWKVIDGDSAIPNKKGIKPCDREGWKGCWVVHFASSFPSGIFNRDGSQAIVEPGAVKRGYYIQVFGDVAGNESSQTPGVFINHRLVALSGYGEEIRSGPDAKAVGFGQAALPAGASSMPVGAMAAPPAAAGAPIPPAAPIAPATPVAPAAPTPPVAAAPAPVPTVPHPAILTPPVPPAAAAPARQMTALANGVTYDQMVAAGWTDALLLQHGYMLA